MSALSRRSFIVMTLALAACQRTTATLKLNGATMGTTYSVVALDNSGALKAADVQAAIETSLAEVNVQMSNWDAGSELSRFNAAQSTQEVSVSPALAKVMQAAQDVHLASDGQFDVTLGPLIELWGFGARNASSATPSDAAIAAALETVGQARTLRVGAETMQKTRPETEIYLSAIGKGYGVDRVAETLASFGLKDYMIEIGGDLYTAGVNPDGMPWQIGIETPDVMHPELQKVVGVSNMGMATSGDYRNYFEVDGTRYSHILDAKTGRPVTHSTASVTVLTENAMLADAWATAMLVLGKDRGMQIADEQNIAALFIDRDDRVASGFVATPSARFQKLQA